MVRNEGVLQGRARLACLFKDNKQGSCASSTLGLRALALRRVACRRAGMSEAAALETHSTVARPSDGVRMSFFGTRYPNRYQPFAITYLSRRMSWRLVRQMPPSSRLHIAAMIVLSVVGG